MEGFVNATHIQVKFAGHEQAQWDKEVANIIIPAFIKGENISSATVFYSAINFIPLSEKASGHPSIK